MTAILRVSAWFLGAVGLAAQAAPVIQNGTVQTQTATSLDAAVRGLGTSADATWIVWREPMIDGDRHLCSMWSDDETIVRGTVLDPRPDTNGRPVLAASAGPVQLEAGTGLLILARIVDGRVERLRTISDDCPIDANGRTVHWLQGIAPAESLRYLATYTAPSSFITSTTRSLAQEAVTAIGLHRDGGADAILDRLFAAGDDRNLRDSAARALASSRGRHGFDEVSRAIAGERDPATRQRLVSALRQSREPDAVETLLRLAKTDANEHVRAEAVQDYALLAGSAGLAEAVAIATTDASGEVERRAVSSIAHLPVNVSVPALLTLARTSANLTVRKEAVGALARIDDPRATAYLEDLVRN